LIVKNASHLERPQSRQTRPDRMIARNGPPRHNSEIKASGFGSRPAHRSLDGFDLYRISKLSEHEATLIEHELISRRFRGAELGSALSCRVTGNCGAVWRTTLNPGYVTRKDDVDRILISPVQVNG